MVIKSRQRKSKRVRKPKKIERRLEDACVDLQQVSLKDLPIAYKKEVILEWSVNCGVVKRKRRSRTELAEMLGMSIDQIKKELDRLHDTRTDLLTQAGAVGKHLVGVMGQVVEQLHQDRALAIMHSESIELEIEETEKKILEFETKLKDEPQYVANHTRRLHYYIDHLNSLRRTKLESIRVVFQSTEAFVRYLSLFSGNKNGKDDPPRPLESLLKPAEPERSTQDFVNHKQAVQLLDDRQGQILPSQKMENAKGPRNPSIGFEEFTEPKGE